MWKLASLSISEKFSFFTLHVVESSGSASLTLYPVRVPRKSIDRKYWSGREIFLLRPNDVGGSGSASLRVETAGQTRTVRVNPNGTRTPKPLNFEPLECTPKTLNFEPLEWVSGSCVASLSISERFSSTLHGQMGSGLRSVFSPRT